MTNERNNQNARSQQWFCCLPGPQWVLFCGISALIIGVLWLLEETGIFYADVWEYALPVLLIIWGTAYIIQYFRQYKKD